MPEKNPPGKLVNRRSFIGASGAALTLWNLTRSVLNGKEGGSTAAGSAAGPAGAHTFGDQGDHFLLDGKPFVIISGSMHYPRVPRPYWRDRMRKMRALGLNTLCTYVFWDLHEPDLGRFDFTGNLDVAAYIRTAQEEGLWVLLRPGPYICSEWDFGGLPPWLLSTPGLKVRTTDARFLEAAAKYLRKVGEQLAPLQITRGGPIIMAQVENEYGSFGHDHDYVKAIRNAIRGAGFDVTLYTSDGSSKAELDGGSMPDSPAAINFGQGEQEKEFSRFAKSRQGVPRMCGEYWDGWFDHWGEEHHVTSREQAARGIDWMLSRGISVNLYMVHGGTSWGFMSGANFDGSYQPDISSYDYNAPIDEAGRPTRKFTLIRDVIAKHSPAGTHLPDLPAPLPLVEIPAVELKEVAALEGLLRKPVHSDHPLTMEELGQNYGFVLYRVVKELKGLLQLKEIRDFAIVSQNGQCRAVLDRRVKVRSRVVAHKGLPPFVLPLPPTYPLEVELEGGAPLDILVENMGRVNYGSHMVDDRKGIVGPVTLEGSTLTGWENYSLPMTDFSQLRFSSSHPKGPAFFRGQFELPSLGDTFLDLRGWVKGCVWVNGHNLGRYWNIGPQQSLFLPATWLIQGTNSVLVFELIPSGVGRRSLRGVKDPIWSTAKS